MIANPIDLSAAIIRDPLVVSLETTVLAAIALMHQERSADPKTNPKTNPEADPEAWDMLSLKDPPSCVVVIDHQRVVGILTEQDILRLTAQQLPLGDVAVGQVMSHPVVSLPAAAFTEVKTASQLFQQHRIRHLPLLNKQGQLAGLVTHNSLRQVALAHKLLRSQRQETLIAEMALRIRQYTEPGTIVTAVVEEVQHFLQADRVVVYQFQPDMSGIIVAEAVVPPWQPCLDVQLNDTCFQENLGGAYREGRVATIADIRGANLDPCYLALLEQFQVRANLVVPIVLPKIEDQSLWGLLIAHQCKGPRHWDETDVYLLQRLSVQLAIALQQADLNQSLQALNASLEQQVKARTQTLQTLADQKRLQANITTQIRASLDLETILNTAVEEIRAVLQCDRVNIWQFGANWQPFVVAESTDSPLSLIGEWVNDTCLQNHVEIYRQGHIRVVPDIYTTEMNNCHRDMLVRLQTRAKVLVPLLCGEQLWGLLNVTESQHARDWQPTEVELLRVLSLQLAIALQQAITHRQLQAELTKRQQTEVRLRAKEAQTRALLTAIPDHLFRVGADGEYRELINRNRDTHLLPVALNPVGSTLAEVLPADIAARHRHHLQQAITTGELQVYEQSVQVGERLLYDEVRVVKNGEDEALFMIRDISDRKRAEFTLQNLIRGTAATTGQDFFPVLVSHIAEALGVAYAIVTERLGDRLQTLAFWANGTLQPNFSYLATPTPCGQALQQGRLYCAQGVQQQFPDCPELVEMGAESYLGISLKDTRGKAIGNLCIYNQQPIPDLQRAEQILQVFAARATAELERQRATTALEQLNQALEAKVAERTATVKEREARYRALVNAIPDLLIRIDADGTYLDVMTGDGVEPFNPEQLQTGVNIYDVTPFEHAQERMGYVDQALQTGEAQSYEYELTIHGQQISETARIVAINDQEALIMVQDISDRKQLEAERQKTEQALRNSEARYRSIFDHAAVGIVHVPMNSNDHRLLVCNPRFCNMLGYTAAELAEFTVDDITHPEDQGTTDMTLLLAGEISHFSLEKRYLRKDGSIMWANTTVSLTRDAMGMPLNTVAVIEDTSDRKQAETELRLKTQELQQSYQDLKETQLQLIQAEKMSSLGQLVAGIAHEINNPVSFIYGNLGAAQNYVTDLKTVLRLYQDNYPEPSPALKTALDKAEISYVLEDFPKLLKSMENGAVRIRDIVASLRTFSRRDQAKRQAIDIHENIDSALVILQNRLNGRSGNPQIQVIKNYGEIPPVECYGSSLNQVFMNLLVNAIDAIEMQQVQSTEAYVGSLTITTQGATDNQVAITIKDNGIGMLPSTQAKIFDPFYTTKPVGVGTGMGLSISYQIVTNDHQGQLTCHSALGTGTEFIIEL